MPGERHLPSLLSRMDPELRQAEYIFCSLSDARAGDLRHLAAGCFKEDEGISLILERAVADRAGVAYEAVWKAITLKVHSDLEAVGFLAAVVAELASAGISTNVVAAYYHDHLFVPARLAEKAMSILRSVQRRAQNSGTT